MAYTTKICVLKACPNRNLRITKKTDIKRHSFPTDPEHKKIWEEFVNKNNFTSSFKSYKGALLCSAHFTPDSYRLPNGKFLRRDAVPTIVSEFTRESALRWGLIRSLEDPGFLQLATGSNSSQPDASSAQFDNTNIENTVHGQVATSSVETGTFLQETVQIVSPVITEDTEAIIISDSEGHSGGATHLLNPLAQRSTLYSILPESTHSQGVQDLTILEDGVACIPRQVQFTHTPAQTENLVTLSEDAEVIVLQEIDVNSCDTGHILHETGGSANVPSPSTPKQSSKRKRYVGEMSPGDFSTPRRAKRLWAI